MSARRTNKVQAGGGDAAPVPPTPATPGPDPDEVERLTRLLEDPETKPGERYRAAAALNALGLLRIEVKEETPSAPEPAILDSKGRPYSQGKPRPERPRPKLITEFLDDIEEEEETYLWPWRIPTGTITVLLARMGDGKSTFLGWLASTVSMGGAWPDCPDDNEPGSVLILQAEENSKRKIKPRMSAFGFGARKIKIIKGVNHGDDRESWFSLAGDVQALADECEKVKDVRLIIVDPISSYIRGVSNFNDTEMRAYFQPLFTLAERYDLAVVAAAHPNKDEDKPILNRMSGSGALLQMARVGWYLSHDPGDRSRRLLSLLKGNPDDMIRTALAVRYDGRKRQITWYPDPIDLDAEQVDNLLQKARHEAKLKARPGRDPVEAKKAEEFVIKLILEKGPCLQSAAQDQALNQGMKESTFRKGLRNAIHTDGRIRKEFNKEDGRLWLHPRVVTAPGPDGEKGDGTAAEEGRETP